MRIKKTCRQQQPTMLKILFRLPTPFQVNYFFKVLGYYSDFHFIKISDLAGINLKNFICYYFIIEKQS